MRNAPPTGAVITLAARLADEASGGQILIEQRLYAEVEDDIEVDSVGEVTLKGFQRPIAAFNVVAVRETAAELSQLETRRSVSGARRCRRTQ